MKLADVQALFWSALAGESPEVERAFVGSAELPAQARVGIYVDMVLWRQVDALREDFPKLNALLGEDEFDALAQAYIRRWPSEHPSLGRLGRKLAEFITACGRPAPADLAALEWARTEVFEEAAVEPATPDGLQSSSRLQLVPALRRLQLAHDAVTTWRALEKGEAASEPVAQPTAVVVWRRDWQPIHAALPPEEADALSRAAAGAPLEDICAPFADAQTAFEAISSWFSEGWIARVDQ